LWHPAEVPFPPSLPTTGENSDRRDLLKCALGEPPLSLSLPLIFVFLFPDVEFYLRVMLNSTIFKVFVKHIKKEIKDKINDKK
jgi:hypothetical protein